MALPKPVSAFKNKPPMSWFHALKGDDRAFAELVRRYRRRIYALGLHMTGRASDADDITQDAFLRAYDKLDTFQKKSVLHLALPNRALSRPETLSPTPPGRRHR